MQSMAMARDWEIPKVNRGDRKKLIEVALPLEAINEASAREKSIRHGHPSTLHLWWARRPLAACRAVLFAQLVDDPSSAPEEFPDEAAQKAERERLFGIIARLVQWKSSNDARVIGDARREIARSVARALSEAPPEGKAAVDAFLAEKAPPVADPFCGGGSIPLEAQRLGLRAHGSDLNPVAVLITRALVEIPPRFAGRPPIHPAARATLGGGADRHAGDAADWYAGGAHGLAGDVRHYGQWMREKAGKRIGRLYPKVAVTDALAADRPDLEPHVGKELTVIAWLWARTVASPNPAARGAHVPLASSFVLSSKKGREAIVVPEVEPGGYRFTVQSGGIGREALARARAGTKNGRGANFTCLVSGAPIPGDHIKAEGMAGRMGARLMAVVAQGKRGRVYVAPAEEMEQAARAAEPGWRPEGAVPRKLTGGTCYGYGLTTFAHLFTDRQLVALTTFSDLVAEAREQVLADAFAAGMDADAPRLADGGAGAAAYADAVATYLGFAIDRLADRGSTICSWDSSPKMEALRNTFARQALPMTWDFAEGNPFSLSSGN